MKRGLKTLAVLAAFVVASAGPQAFAVCGEFGGFPVFQCADRAYFDAPPAGAGAVSSSFFQVGFGNSTVSTGQPGTSLGTGMTGLTTFNGNDNGLFGVDLTDAAVVIGDSRVPAGALCLRSNNWGNAGIDGCCDNNRDQVQQFGNDDILNPEYDVYYSRAFNYGGYASLDWVQDYPMAILLTEAGGNHFAFAAVATMARSGANDLRKGFYAFNDVSNGTANPIDGLNNIVPWQRIPGNPDASNPASAFVTNVAFLTPGDPSSDRLLDLSWIGATVHSDGSIRPSTHSTLTSTGVGVSEIGSLVRYVIETQTVGDPSSDPFPQLLEASWVAAETHPEGSTSRNGLQVPVNTCVRLSTAMGRAPTTGTTTIPNCRLGKCGDLGYSVSSPPACVGGPLVADGVPTVLQANRSKGQVTITWRTDTELTVTGFDVFADKGSSRKLLGNVSCQSCNGGGGGSYELVVKSGDLKGARDITVSSKGPNASSTTRIK
jgi:hypothetical protein